MAECNVQVGAINIAPTCEALRAPGGVKKDTFIGNISQVAGYTIDATTKAISGITLKTGAKLGKLTGRKAKNNTAVGYTPNEFINLYSHSFTFLAFINTQLEKEDLEKIADAEDVFAIVHNTDGTFEAFGLAAANGRVGEGMRISGLERNSGTELTDGRPTTLTFTGEETKLPMYVLIGADEVATLQALEDMNTTPAV